MAPKVSLVSPRRLVIDGDPSEVAAFVANCQCSGIHVENVPPRQTAMKKPVPLGIPVMNFRREQKPAEKQVQAGVQNRRTDGKPVPLGIPVMRF